ncbi:MAG: chloride channel protein [Acidimicrobiales bacterium]
MWSSWSTTCTSALPRTDVPSAPSSPCRSSESLPGALRTRGSAGADRRHRGDGGREPHGSRSCDGPHTRDHGHGICLRGAVRCAAGLGALRTRDPSSPWPRVLRSTAPRALRRAHRLRSEPLPGGVVLRSCLRARTGRGRTRYRSGLGGHRRARRCGHRRGLHLVRPGRSHRGRTCRHGSDRRSGPRRQAVELVVVRCAHLRGTPDRRPRQSRCRGQVPRRRARLKLIASAVCAATGWRGGFIIPLFFAGAACGLLLHEALPSVDATMLMAAAMVAACTGVTKTPWARPWS